VIEVRLRLCLEDDSQDTILLRKRSRGAEEKRGGQLTDRTLKVRMLGTFKYIPN
jgi:hypothetical protein